jgi:hypothetical protein
MNSAATFLLAIPISAAPVATAAPPTAPPAALSSQDVVTLQNGQKYMGRILAADETSVQLQIRPAADQPPASIRLPLSAVVHAQFHSEPGLDLATASLSTLGSLWERHAQFAQVPGSPAPTLGLQYAELLLDSLSAAAAQNALDLLLFLEKAVPGLAEKMVVRQKRLRALVAVHRLELAAKEARQILKSPAPPPLTAESLIVLGLEAQTALQALEKEHPRWMVDDRTRPQRQALFYEALDAFLDAALQPNPDPSIASRALWNAARLYQQNGTPEAATACLRDIVWFYGTTFTASQARPALATEESTHELPTLPPLSFPNAP